MTRCDVQRGRTRAKRGLERSISPAAGSNYPMSWELDTLLTKTNPLGGSSGCDM